MTIFGHFTGVTLSSGFGLITGVSTYVILQRPFQRYSSRRLTTFQLRYLVHVWSIFIVAAGITTILGSPLVVSLQIPSDRILASLFPTTLALGVVALIRFLVVERSEAFANTLILWIPASFSVLVFLAIYAPDLVQQMFSRIVDVDAIEFQTISLTLFVGSWCIFFSSEVIAWFAMKNQENED